MIRDIERELLEWKSDKRRRPLLLRGARQVGKSYTVERIGNDHFSSMVNINFELQPEFKKCFDSLEPTEILQKISVLVKREIIPGSTLLFFDEIQECPEAISSLRYFYEKMPELHVIGAGSLLEFAIRRKKFKMPVGRVQYMYMKPISFGEFLTVNGEERLREVIIKAKPDKSIESIFHDKGLKLLKKYMLIGGMPAVVDEYIETQSLNKCLDIQSNIIQTFMDDLPKYATEANHKYLKKVFIMTPRIIGQKFKYSKIDPDTQSKFLKSALELLEDAGIIYKVKVTSGSGVPLEAVSNENHFKAIFLDIGLVQRICGLDKSLILEDNLLKINDGSLAEQLVGQELLASNPNNLHNHLYYWERTKAGSTAEIDYLTNIGSDVVPIEVKAGATGRLLSLHSFMKKYHVETGVQISQAPYGQVIRNNKTINSIPLYGVESLFV